MGRASRSADLGSVVVIEPTVISAGPLASACCTMKPPTPYEISKNGATIQNTGLP